MIFNLLIFKKNSLIFDKWCCLLLPFIYFPVLFITITVTKEGMVASEQLKSFSVSGDPIELSKYMDIFTTSVYHNMFIVLVILCCSNTYIRMLVAWANNCLKQYRLDTKLQDKSQSNFPKKIKSEFQKRKEHKRQRLARQMTMLAIIYSISSIIFRLQFNISKFTNMELPETLKKIIVVLSLTAPSIFALSYLLFQRNSSDASDFGNGFKLCHLIRNKKLYLSFRHFLIANQKENYFEGLDYVEECSRLNKIGDCEILKKIGQLHKNTNGNSVVYVYFFDTAIYIVSKDYLKSEFFNRFEKSEKADTLNTLGEHEPWLDVKQMDKLMEWNAFALEVGS